MPDQISQSARILDLSPRIVTTTTVAGSPALAAETVIATLQFQGNLSLVQGAMLDAYAAFTVGTTGTAAQLRIRQSTVAGSIVANSGALTAVAANLVGIPLSGLDPAPPATLVYVLTLQITGGSAVSTVSAVSLRAIMV